MAGLKEIREHHNTLRNTIEQQAARIQELEGEVKLWKDSHDAAVSAAYKKRCELEAVVDALKEANVKFIGTRADKLNAALAALDGEE